MGSWGVKALESDSGLDVIDFMLDQYEGRKTLSLKELLKDLRAEGFLNSERDDIDYLYDSTAIVVAELVVQYQNFGKFTLERNADDEYDLDEIESFRIDKASLQNVVQHLKDIDNERPDQDGEREYSLLWREGELAKDWNEHLKQLIKNLEEAQ